MDRTFVNTQEFEYNASQMVLLTIQKIRFLKVTVLICVIVSENSLKLIWTLG